MSTGFSNSDYDFGTPETSQGSAARPADIARASTAAPSPADAALAGVESKGGFRRGRRRAERIDASGVPLPSAAVMPDSTQESSQRKAGRDAKNALNRAQEDASYSATRDASMLAHEDKRTRRRKKAILSVLLVVLTLLSLFVDAGYSQFFNPGEVFACYGLAIQQFVMSFTDPTHVLSGSEILSSGHMAYYRILNRVGITVMTVLCGGVLALAGSLYQSAFRNPIASPSMLGVSSAIQLGDAILVLLFSAAAATHLGERYLICYACVIVVMVVLFTFSKIMTGKGRPFNVTNLLLTAVILTQLIGVVVTYITMFVFTYEEWEVYTTVSESLTVDLGVFGWSTLLGAFVVGLVPIWLLRFRLNGLNFEDTEMRLLGINAPRLRFLALICGTILIMGVQVQMGTVAMIALVVPHVSRMVFGAEFRKQLWGNVLIGSSLLIFCRIVLGFVPVINTFLPISVVVNFAVLPFFVWMLATQQRGWE